MPFSQERKTVQSRKLRKIFHILFEYFSLGFGRRKGYLLPQKIFFFRQVCLFPFKNYFETPTAVKIAHHVSRSNHVRLLKMCIAPFRPFGHRVFILPSFAPLLKEDGSLQRLRHPSLQQSVPFTHDALSRQVFLNPIRQSRFSGGLGQVS